jgi:hypothetical protein
VKNSENREIAKKTRFLSKSLVGKDWAFFFAEPLAKGF